MEFADSNDNYLVNQHGQATKTKLVSQISKALTPYSIIQDLKDQLANITFGQLLQVAPSIRAELIQGLR